MVQIAKKTRRYLSDITDEEWVALPPCFPSRVRGWLREVNFCKIINEVCYLVRLECGWRLPSHFGAWQAVYS